MKHPLMFFVASLIAMHGALLGLSALDSNTDEVNVLKKPPEFYVLDWQPGTILMEAKTDLFIEVDSMGRQEVKLWVDHKDQAVLYSSNVSTPVCADGECKLMHIRLYWTLLGDYAGFDRYPNMPLTKHDHEEFLISDYERLHQLLMDDNSVLKQRSIDQLVEAPTQRVVNGVDALSGATIAEVKESVVSGALYSCYVAWHMVHGEVRAKIKTYTSTKLNNDLLLTMLNSSNRAYQMFALQQLNEQQYVDQYLDIAEVFKKGTPLIRGFIIKNVPEIFWTTPELQMPYWDEFTRIDIGSRSLLLEHLENAPHRVQTIIMNNLGVLTKNQLKTFLYYLNTSRPSTELLRELETFANDPNEKYSYLALQFLEEI